MIELKEFVKLPTFRGGSLSASATRPLRSQSSGSEPSAAPALLGATREEIMEALQQKEAAVEHLYSEGEVQAALSELLVQGRATKEEVGREWTAAVAQAFGGVIRRMQREMLKKRHIPAVREESRPENGRESALVWSSGVVLSTMVFFFYIYFFGYSFFLILYL